MPTGSPENLDPRLVLRRGLLFTALAVGGCLVDLATKWFAFDRLGMPGEEETVWLIRGYWGFRTSLNEGALFGVGQGFTFLFAGLSIVAAVFIVYWLFWTGAARDRTLTLALACVMAGIFGNLYDRLGLHGLRWHLPTARAGEPVYAVRDFIHWTAGRFEWPTFNIADSLLVCGAGLLMLHAFRNDGSPESRPAAPPTA